MKAKLQQSALVMVDIQNDFCPGGALAVEEGDRIVEVVNRLIPQFQFVISTQDWHPAGHISFKERGGPWPPHCVEGTEGAELHPALDRQRITHYFRKASNPDKDAYSEFEGTDDCGRTLDETLRSHNIKRVYVVGLATDYCVKATAMDAIKLGYEVFVVTDAVRAVNVSSGDGDKALGEMARAGAHLVTSDQLAGWSGSKRATAR